MLVLSPAEPAKQSSHELTISRVLYGISATIIYLGSPLPATSSDLPEARRATVLLLLGLASDGVYNAPRVTTRAVVSYTAISPLPACEDRRYTFCCTFLGVTSTGRYPASCPVKPGLSSVFQAIVWLTHVTIA